jgi:tetratricopeptide (TPR) repeat protein
VYKACNLQEKAQDHFKQAAEASNFGDAVWAWKASQQLPNFNSDAGKEKLQRVLEHAKDSGESSSASWWLYNAGTMDSALGNTQLAESEFRQALLLPDSLMSYHLTRLALTPGAL